LLDEKKKDQQSQPNTNPPSSVPVFTTSIGDGPSIRDPQMLVPNSSLSKRSTAFREATVSVSMHEMNLEKRREIR
jgi:hypothetical protein